MAHREDGKIPYNTVSGKIYDHGKTRIFGSHVTVLKNGKRPALGGYSRTTKKILYVPYNNLGKRIIIVPPVTIAL